MDYYKKQESGDGEMYGDSLHIGHYGDYQSQYNESDEDNSIDSYSIEDNGDVGISDSGNNSPSRPKVSPWVLLIRMFVSPLRAWKRLKNSGLTPDEVSSKMFYPLIAVASLGQFLHKIYNPALSLGFLLEGAIGVFISFFLGYFLVLVLCRGVLPGDGKEKIDTLYGRTWLQYIFSTLCIFYFIYEAVPVLEPVIVFAPLYTLYITLRGTRFLRMKEGNESSVGWTVGLLSVGVPYGINYLFEAIVPSV